MQNPSQHVAVIMKRRDLITNEFEHLELMALYQEPERYFGVIGRLACAVAELHLKTSEAVNDKLTWTLMLMLNYVTDTLSDGMEVGRNTQRLLEINRRHVIECARNMARLMPTGVWSDFHFQQANTESVIYTGTLHAVDYR
jgi:hypothetical protein